MARKRSRRRSGKSKVRKPKKRIFVATEGVTEHKYFNKLKTELGVGNVDILKSTSKTSPRQVVNRLAKYKPKDGDIREIDELWAVIDKDDHSLSQIFSETETKRYCFADSNPCFEVWLVLHFEALDRLSGFAGSTEIGGCAKVIEFLKRRFDNNYHKTNYDVQNYLDRYQNAESNAEKADKCKQDLWMETVGSRVYKLAGSIIKSSANNPSD